MIQRYSVNLDTKPYSWTTDNEGEWVKWQDIKHLIPFHKALMEQLLKTESEITNDNPSKRRPIGIMSSIKDTQENEQPHYIGMNGKKAYYPDPNY